MLRHYNDTQRNQRISHWHSSFQGVRVYNTIWKSILQLSSYEQPIFKMSLPSSEASVAEKGNP